MDNPASGRGEVKQFRNLSDGDKRLIERIHSDRQKPTGGTRHIDTNAVKQTVHRTLRTTSDVRNIFTVMPDLNLPREMLVSAICAPGDLATTSLNISSNISGGSNPLSAAIVDALEQFYIKEQGLQNKVPDWIDDSYILSGAHPIMIIPEASIDQLIMGRGGSMSLESVANYGGEFVDGWYKPKNILGVPFSSAKGDQYISMESASQRIDRRNMAEYHTIKIAPPNNKTIKLPFMVTDNMAVFRKPVVAKIKKQSVFKNAYGTPSLEARRSRRLREEAEAGKTRTPTTGEVYANYFKPPQKVRRSRLEVVPTLRQAGGVTYGHPLVYHLASEAVVPISVPGDETNHIGYIVLLDQNGYPVSFSRRLNFYDDVRRSGVMDNSAVAGELIQMSKETIQGGSMAFATDQAIDRIATFQGDIIEADIIQRLKSGMMEGDFELSRTEHADRLWFSRCMKNQMTTMLYVPAELMIYMAFDYNEYGVGKSILEDAIPLAAQRAALQVANSIGSAKAAIPGKDINIELDPEINDPVAAVTFMAQEAINLNFQDFPMSVQSPSSIAQQLVTGGISINVTGNPKYPSIQTSVTQRESTFRPVDESILRSLRDDLVRIFSLTPEMVDGSSSPDFATTVVQNNLMLLKRVMAVQAVANPYITDYVRVFTMNSGALIEQIMALIESNKQHLPKEYKDDPESYLEDFMNTLQVKLPAPVNDVIETQLEQFESYAKALDSVISQAYLRDEFLDGYATELQRQALPSLVAAWKGQMLRKYMQEHGLFRELDIFSNNEDGSPMVDMLGDVEGYVKSLKTVFGKLSERMAEDALDRKKENERLAALDTKAKATLESPPPEEPSTLDSGTSDELTDTGDAGTGLDDTETDTSDAEPQVDDTPPVEEDTTNADDETGGEPDPDGELTPL